MKNQLISFVMAVVMMAGMLGTVAFADIGKDFSEQSTFLLKIGALSADGDLTPGTKITRARFTKEFTAFINSLDYVDENAIQTKSYYYDVPMDNEYIAYINYLTENGYVIGDDGSRFRPDDNITNMEMLKCVVAAVGYTASAGISQYPGGYLAVAGSLKLTDDIGALGADATIESMIQLFANAMDVNVMERSLSEKGKFEINKNITYMEKVFGVYMTEGQIDGNYMTTLDAESSSMKSGVITVDGYEYSLTEENYYLADFLGYKMKFYYKEDGTDRIIVAAINEDTEETVVSSTAITEYKDNKLFYITGNSDRAKKISIDPNAVIIYNGVTVKSYTDDIFTLIPVG